MPADFRSQLDAIRSSPDAAATRLHSLFEAAWGHAMEESPESATVLGYRGHDHRWSDLSPDAIARSREDARASLDALRSIDPSGLDEVDRLSWLLFEKGREDELESARFHPEYQPVN